MSHLCWSLFLKIPSVPASLYTISKYFGSQNVPKNWNQKKWTYRKVFYDLLELNFDITFYLVK